MRTKLQQINFQDLQKVAVACTKCRGDHYYKFYKQGLQSLFNPVQHERMVGYRAAAPVPVSGTQ